MVYQKKKKKEDVTRMQLSLPLAHWVPPFIWPYGLIPQYSPMVRETWVQSQVTSYERL